jgi:hypothetical protein
MISARGMYDMPSASTNLVLRFLHHARRWNQQHLKLLLLSICNPLWVIKVSFCLQKEIYIEIHRLVWFFVCILLQLIINIYIWLGKGSEYITKNNPKLVLTPFSISSHRSRFSTSARSHLGAVLTRLHLSIARVCVSENSNNILRGIAAGWEASQQDLFIANLSTVLFPS